MATQEICFRVRKRGQLKIEWLATDVETDAKFRIYDTLWKLEISIPIVEALPMTEPPEYIWWPSTARLLSKVYC